MIQEKSDDGTLYKRPQGYKNGKSLAGLMTLKSFVDGGYDVVEGKILVCVKSIGGHKKCKFQSSRQIKLTIPLQS